MIKQKLVLILALLAAPMLFVSTPASAHRYYHHCCCCSGYLPKHMTAADVVRARIERNPMLASANVTVSTYGNHRHAVMLKGYANSVAQKHALIDTARWTCGVRLVVDGVVEQ